jgi:hypothetical protein
VQSVTANGSALSFIQEDKNDDADFAVILSKPLNEGEKFTITTTYAGKDAVTNEGSGNYIPIARQNWYPNGAGSALGEYATYDMTFRIPKGMKLAATGVAGFSFGKFKVEEAKLTKPPVFIQSFANEESPSWVRSFQRSTEANDLARGPYGATGIGSEMSVGTMSTVTLNKKALAEGEIAVQIYTDYFGPSQFTRLELTQQTACNFGQSWPGLVWIPICYYFETTVRHALGIDWGDRGYWTVVTPHEVAHQWWGHTVGFTSYRDQWMSEGFADMSASLYLSFTEKDQKKLMKFWSDERDILLEKDAQGFRPIDVGPLTMGYRASNSRTGFGVTRRLIYPKGAYVLHMIRMMMWDPRAGDKPFKDAMQDFVNTYRGKAATTEDFKAVLEKHMSPQMDMEGNHKLDWFFNEYVYGTQLPSYKFDSTLGTDPDGSVVLSFSISQFNVDGKFAMLVPIYLELEDGSVIMLARAPVIGSTTFSDKISLKALKSKPRRAMINYHYDVLASN